MCRSMTPLRGAGVAAPARVGSTPASRSANTSARIWSISRPSGSPPVLVARAMASMWFHAAAALSLASTGRTGRRCRWRTRRARRSGARPPSCVRCLDRVGVHGQDQPPHPFAQLGRVHRCASASSCATMARAVSCSTSDNSLHNMRHLGQIQPARGQRLVQGRDPVDRAVGGGQQLPGRIVGDGQRERHLGIGVGVDRVRLPADRPSRRRPTPAPSTAAGTAGRRSAADGRPSRSTNSEPDTPADPASSSVEQLRTRRRRRQLLHPRHRRLHAHHHDTGVRQL